MESQQICEMLMDLRRLVAGHGEFLAKFGQHTPTEEAPDSRDGSSPPHPPWHTRPRDQQPVAAPPRFWSFPPSVTQAPLGIKPQALPRLRLEPPRFDGENALDWICKIQEYYNYHYTPLEDRLYLIKYLFDHPASEWMSYWTDNNPDKGWEDFLVAVRYHFAPEVDDEERFGGSSLCAGIPNEVSDVFKPTAIGEVVSDDSHALDGKLEDARVLPMCNKLLRGTTTVENSESRENSTKVAASNGLAASMIFEECAATLKEDVAALVPSESEQPTGSFEIKELNELNSFLCTDRSKSDSVLDFLGFNTELQPQNFNVINGKLRVLSEDIQGDFGDAAGLLDRYGDARTIPPSIPDDVVVHSVASKLVTDSLLVPAPNDVVTHGSDARIYTDGATPTLFYSDDMKASFCGDAKWSRASLQFGANNGVLIFDPGAFVPNDSRNPASSNFLVIICHSLAQELTLEEVVNVSILPQARIFIEYANWPFNRNSSDHRFCSAPARRRFYDNPSAVRHHFHAGMRIPAQQISKLQKKWSRHSFKGHIEKKQCSITQDLKPDNVENEDDYSLESVDDKVRTEMRMAVDLATTLERVENKKVITLLRLIGNHIVFYSTSFLELTEDSREEFFGRNCRLMQGPATDPSRGRMARESLDNQREVINHWNSFYLHPTYDLIGEMQDFIGDSQLDFTVLENDLWPITLAEFCCTNGFIGEPITQQDSMDIVSCVAVTKANDELGSFPMTDRVRVSVNEPSLQSKMDVQMASRTAICYFDFHLEGKGDATVLPHGKKGNGSETNGDYKHLQTTISFVPDFTERCQDVILGGENGAGEAVKGPSLTSENNLVADGDDSLIAEKHEAGGCLDGDSEFLPRGYFHECVNTEKMVFEKAGNNMACVVLVAYVYESGGEDCDYSGVKDCEELDGFLSKGCESGGVDAKFAVVASIRLFLSESENSHQPGDIPINAAKTPAVLVDGVPQCQWMIQWSTAPATLSWKSKSEMLRPFLSLSLEDKAIAMEGGVDRDLNPTTNLAMNEQPDRAEPAPITTHSRPKK